MSYLVLARKWRPQTFEEVVGQQPVVRTLRNAILRHRVSHAMLFSGVRGVGKTTLARIMAKALNCHSGPTEIPCNHCESCTGITAGTAIDLHEIDGASNRGIQEIRELKENIRFFPTSSRYKIIIIDEVHMLTTEAFNALLKTLEEPPDHVYFMFATTELHKIPITILSRCQRYELKRVPGNELADFFKKIAQEEKIVISEAALGKVVREAEGSVRDGLSLLDQIFSFADTRNEAGELEVLDEDVVQILGLIDSRIIASLAHALLTGDLSGSLKLFAEAFAHGIGLKRFTNDLLSYFRSLLVCKVVLQPENILDVADQDLQDMRETASGYSAETLHNYFQLLLHGVEEMQYSKHPRLVLETTFIKIVQAGNIVPVSALLEKMDNLLQGGGAAVSKKNSTIHDGSQTDKLRGPASSSSAKPKTPLKPSTGQGAALSSVGKDPGSISSTEELGTPPETPLPAEKTSDVAEKRNRQKDVRRHWDEFIDYVMERKKWMALALKLCCGVREENTVLEIKFNEPADCKMLQTSEHMKALTEFAQDFFQRGLKIRIKIKGGGTKDFDNQENGGPQEERRALANDPLVLATTEIFNAQIVNIRTGPRSR